MVGPSLIPTPIEIAIAALVLIVAGFAIGAVGFGFGLTTTPVLLLFLDPQTVVVTINAVAVVAFGLVLIETRDHVPYRELAPTAVAGALGAPIGVYALASLDPAALRIAISALVLMLTVLIVVKTEWRVPKPQITGPMLGFGVAAMVTGLAIGGPLLVLFFIGRGMERQGVRSSMAFFFTTMYCTAAIGYVAQGLLTAERLILIVAVVPGMILGYWLSVRLTGRMNEKVFRQAVVSVIAVASILVLVREILSL
ncbi:MAG: sulfite exporter TauE/SafE family protein [Gemmatimonadetes bacterium]|nr:sulfite exporter TauE/SafE family protein [Gemmatimonadota bacterium]